MKHFSGLSAMMATAAMPRSVMALPRAEENPAALFAQLNSAFSTFAESQRSRMDAIEAAVDSNLASNALRGMSGGIGVPIDAEYSEVFASYVRSGGGEDALRKANSEGTRSAINASLSSGNNSDGGYLAPTEWDRSIRKKQEIISPMRSVASVVATGVGAFSTVWHTGQWGSGWVGEEAARPETTGPQFSTLEFGHGEIYANVAVTQRLLDDSEVRMDEWLTTEVSDEFTRQEGIAFISGNGVNKPFGLLTYVAGGAADARHPGGNLTIVNSGAAAAFDADALIGFAYSLTSPYRQGATWLMNSTTAATIAKLKDGNGAYIWREGLVAGQPATLLGYPVAIDEGMPDVAADALPIAFGNFQRGYVINDRTGARILRDPFTNKPFVMFYSTKRVGGGVLDPNAIRILKIAA